MKLWMIGIMGLTCGCAAITGSYGSEVAPVGLRCEYLANPIGSDSLVPRLSWKLDAGNRKSKILNSKDTPRGVRQTAYQVLVASSEKLLKEGKADLWDSGKVESDQSVHVEYGGKPLQSRMRCFWKVKTWTTAGNSWSDKASWTMGLLEPEAPSSPEGYAAAGWSAKWIGWDRHDGSPEAVHPEQRRLPARYVRRDFQVAGKVVRATAHVCGLGLFELRLNGRKVGDHVLDPGLTQYDKRALYVTFDIRRELQEGANTVGIILGNGRYHAMRTNVPFRMQDFGFPKLLLQIEVEYEDGTRQTVISDENWSLTDNGPIRANNEYDGEEYDARMELTGWDKPGYDASAWWKAERVSAPRGRLRAQMIEPIRVTEVRKPVAITQPKPCMFLVDMGQSFYGTVRLNVTGPAGTRVQMRSAYALNADGTLRVQDNRSAKTTDTYTLKGDGAEQWSPCFRGQGYRYAEVTGYPGTPTVDHFEGLVMHTDFEPVGEFKCSNDLINRIQKSIRWTQRAYLRSVPMEPDRDERQGWLGTQAKDFESNGYNFNMASLLGKWLEDIRLDQLEDGHIPDVSPTFWAMYNSGIVWPSNIMILPEIQYDFYGDRRALEANYAAMTGWMTFVSRHLKPDFTVDLQKFGDWCDAYSMDGGNDRGATPDALIATAYYFNNCRIAARIAGLLDRPDDAIRFEELAAKIKEGFHKRFFDVKNHTYGAGTQACDVLPLAFDMVPSEHRAAVAEHLALDVMVERGGHLSVGMVGVFWLMEVLTNTGHGDVAYRVATQTTRPSWGYMLSKGATTIWERWDTDTRGPGMNSESLLILAGNLNAWFYQTLAGINYDKEKPGFKHIVIKPRLLGDLAWVECHYDSMYGRIRSGWRREGNRLTMEVTIPPNSTATVYVPALPARRSPGEGGSGAGGPAADDSSVTESGVEAAKAKGVKFLRMEHGAAVLEVGSGTYRFKSEVN